MVWRSETCSHCGTHPSEWNEKQGGYRNAYAARWRFCRPCELLAQAEAAGPPSESPGWHLELVPTQPKE